MHVASLDHFFGFYQDFDVVILLLLHLFVFLTEFSHVELGEAPYVGLCIDIVVIVWVDFVFDAVALRLLVNGHHHLCLRLIILDHSMFRLLFLCSFLMEGLLFAGALLIKGELGRVFPAHCSLELIIQCN